MTLEQRVEALEKEVAALKEQVSKLPEDQKIDMNTLTEKIKTAIENI